MENKHFLGLGEKWHLQQIKKTISDIQERIENTETEDVSLFILKNRFDQVNTLLNECDSIIESMDLSTDVDELFVEKITEKGIEVFGSIEVFGQWIVTHNIALGTKPLLLLDTNEGLKKIENSLHAIDYGGFA